jgi:hypothetical protein
MVLSYNLCFDKSMEINHGKVDYFILIFKKLIFLF